MSIVHPSNTYILGVSLAGPVIGHVTEIYELVCILMLLTKESHACG